MPDINMQYFGELQRNQHSIDVEIDASQIASPQQDFPMMLETSNTSNSVLNVVAINELGEQLPTEIEGIANDKNWVHLKDLVQDVTNHKMKVFFGGSVGRPVADSTYGSRTVWDSNYKAVYHMNQEPNGNPANALKDSTSNAYHQNPHGFAVNSLIDGEYGKGIAFDDTNDYFDRTAAVVSTGNWNVLIQHKTGSDITNYHNLISATNASQYYIARHLCIYNGYHASYDTAWFYAPTALSINTEYIATFNYAVAGTLDYYLDGVSTGSDTVDTGFDTMEIQTIGAFQGGAIRFYNSNIYEIRYSDIARSSNYIITSHNNLDNPTANGNSPFYKLISKEHDFAESLQSLGRVG